MEACCGAPHRGGYAWYCVPYKFCRFMALPAFTSLTEVRLSHCPFINGNVMDVLLRTSLRLKHLEIADCPRVAFIDQGAT